MFLVNLSINQLLQCMYGVRSYVDNVGSRIKCETAVEICAVVAEVGPTICFR